MRSKSDLEVVGEYSAGERQAEEKSLGNVAILRKGNGVIWGVYRANKGYYETHQKSQANQEKL